VSHFYSAFGLTLHSNTAIAGLVELRTAAVSFSTDVEIHLGISPVDLQRVPSDSDEITYASSETNESGGPLVRIFRMPPDDFLRIEFDEGAQFWLDRSARQVWSVWQAPLTVDDVASYLLGPVFGFFLRLRGVLCLHASAISVGDRAVAFVGPPGAGKSTMAAAFASRGFPAISDDIVGLIERGVAFLALPAYPYLSLWPDSVGAIFGHGSPAQRVSVNWEKQRLPLGAPHLPFESRPLPLGGIFLLGERREAGESARPVPPREALVALLANSYATNALDSKCHADEFGVLGRLVAAVPVWSLHPAADRARLPDLCESVLRQFRSLRRPVFSAGLNAVSEEGGR